MSNKQIKILHYIRKYRYLNKILAKSGYSLDEYEEFQENFPDGSIYYMEFSDDNFDNNTVVTLTPKADALLDAANREKLRTSISIVSIVIAAAAFIKSFFFC